MPSHTTVSRSSATSWPPSSRIRSATRARADRPPDARVFWDRRGFFALIHRHELEPDADVREWFAQRAALTRIVEDTVRRAIAAGDLRPIDPRLATEMLFGMLRAANRYRARTDAFETLVHTVMETFLRGVATPAGQRRLAAVQQRRRA
jgi:hypothetical protein